MDRLRQEFRIAEMPDETEEGMGEALSLWEVLDEYRKLELPKSPIEGVTEKPIRHALAPLVKSVLGEDPKRWARRIEKRISDGDESVTFLQKQAARRALL